MTRLATYECKVLRIIERSLRLKGISLESWTQYEDQSLFEWQVFNDNINETIIDGSAPSGNIGSCILIYNEDDCITPTIMGFTIQNGIGTQVTRNPDTEDEQTQILKQRFEPTISA